MRLVGREKLDTFAREHADARSWIENWIADVEAADWKRDQDIKDRYRAASFLANNFVIFNVKGNRYRLEIQVAFKTGIVFVKRVGTHAEHQKWS